MKHAFSKIVSFAIFLLAYVLCTFVKEPLTLKLVVKRRVYIVKVENGSSDSESSLEQKEKGYGNS